MGKEKTHHHRSERHRRRSRSSERGRRAQVRKGIGACLFTLGIPLVIAGSIILIVANTNGEEQSVPTSFPVLGPILISLAVIFFAVGSIMTEMISIKPCFNYCIPDDPKQFCWKRCPLLFSLLRPNDVTLLNRREAGLNALHSAPSKPVLKKPSEFSKPPPGKRGVRFSDSDAETGNVRISVSSEHSETAKGDNSPSTSLLSLRHCKIYPKEGERWGSVVSDQGVEEMEEEGDGEAVVFTLSGNVDEDQDVFVNNQASEHVTDIDQSDGNQQTRSSGQLSGNCDGQKVIVECDHL